MRDGLFAKALFRPAGDRGILVEYGQGIDPAVNTKVRAMARLLEQDMPSGVHEVIPTYRSLLILYDPLISGFDTLVNELVRLETTLDHITLPAPDVVEIPVCYGGEYGPDMDTVARIHELCLEEVIRIHCSTDYLIYMVGFTPGFPFLGGLDERLHTPRLTTPRMRVPRGSVGIANNQTGIYPVTSPGGWQIIGRTPLTLFAPDRPNPFLYKAGDAIRFRPITSGEFERLAAQEAA